MTESSMRWISISPKLSEGIAVSNTIDNTKFALLLSRLFKATKDYSKQQISNPFTEDELTKLQLSLKLNEDNLKLALNSLVYLIKRAVYFIMKPTFLQDELTEKLKLDNLKAETFVKLWTESTKASFNLERRQQLEEISWELNLEVASDRDLKKSIPKSLIQLQVKNNDGESEKVTVEMDEKQLLELYNQLECMQGVLDSVRS